MPANGGLLLRWNLAQTKELQLSARWVNWPVSLKSSLHINRVTHDLSTKLVLSGNADASHFQIAIYENGEAERNGIDVFVICCIKIIISDKRPQARFALQFLFSFPPPFSLSLFFCYHSENSKVSCLMLR